MSFLIKPLSNASSFVNFSSLSILVAINSFDKYNKTCFKYIIKNKTLTLFYFLDRFRVYRKMYRENFVSN